MSLDFPASASALADITAATGIRAEWLLPVLFHESGFDPAIQNRAGAPYYGLGQNGVDDIQNYAGTDPQTYMTWPASKQLATVIKGYFSAAVHSAGPLRSGVRVYQAEYLPGTLNSAKKLDDVIASASNDPHGFYKANAGLDANHDGAITLADLATVVAASARQPAVQQAIKDTYAARDSMAGNPFSKPPPTDVNWDVYGDDYPQGGGGSDTNNVIAAVAVLVLAGAVAYGIKEDAFDGVIRKVKRLF